MVHFKPDHERIIKKENYPVFNDRSSEWLRNSDRRINAIVEAKKIYQSVKDFYCIY
jgi:hypothetical protein